METNDEQLGPDAQELAFAEEALAILDEIATTLERAAEARARATSGMN